MTDSPSGGIPQFTNEVKAVTGEIVKDVKDNVGQMLEQGVQSVVGTTLTPQQIQQQKQEEQTKLAEARRKIDYWKKIEVGQKGVRDVEKQKQMAKVQQEEEEKKNKKLKEEQRKNQVIFSPAKKGPQFPGQPEDIALSKPELRTGHGKGG